MNLDLKNQIYVFYRTKFEPLALRFGSFDEDSSIFHDLEAENSEEDKLNYLYRLLDDVSKLKSQAEFLLWTATYYGDFKKDELEDQDFVYGSDGLHEMELYVKSRIEIIENRIGKRYWQEYKIANSKREQQHQFQTIFDEHQTAYFFKLLIDKKIIDPPTKKNCGIQIDALTGYSAEGVRQKLSDPQVSKDQKKFIITTLQELTEKITNQL